MLSLSTSIMTVFPGEKAPELTILTGGGKGQREPAEPLDGGDAEEHRSGIRARAMKIHRPARTSPQAVRPAIRARCSPLACLAGLADCFSKLLFVALITASSMIMPIEPAACIRAHDLDGIQHRSRGRRPAGARAPGRCPGEDDPVTSAIGRPSTA